MLETNEILKICVSQCNNIQGYRNKMQSLSLFSLVTLNDPVQGYHAFVPFNAVDSQASYTCKLF